MYIFLLSLFSVHKLVFDLIFFACISALDYLLFCWLMKLYKSICCIFFTSECQHWFCMDCFLLADEDFVLSLLTNPVLRNKYQEFSFSDHVKVLYRMSISRHEYMPIAMISFNIFKLLFLNIFSHIFKGLAVRHWLDSSIWLPIIYYNLSKVNKTWKYFKTNF